MAQRLTIALERSIYSIHQLSVNEFFTQTNQNLDARSVIVIYKTWNYEKILSFVEDRY